MDELIILKYLNQTASQAEMAAVEDWINEADANKKEFMQLKKLWEMSDQLKGYQTFDTNAAWKKVQKTIEVENQNTLKQTIKRIPLQKEQTSISKYRPLLQIAAVILVFFMVGLIFYQNYFTITNPSPIYKIAESSDNLLKVNLSDGSTVWLNQNSTLKYPTTFPTDSRNVLLTGEAFFEVNPNPAKPFVIEAGNTNVKVLGTSFNVNSRDAAHIEVTVESGKVQFYNKEGDGNKVYLEKSEKGIFENNKVSKTINNDPNFLSWKTGVLKFEDQPLSKVLPAIKRHFGKNIQIAEGSPIANCKLNYELDNQSLEVLLKDMELIFGFSFTTTKDGYLLKGEACN
ncbi:MAG: FecR domain-containing protein [Chitinophagales bacterium]